MLLGGAEPLPPRISTTRSGFGALFERIRLHLVGARYPRYRSTRTPRWALSPAAGLEWTFQGRAAPRGDHPRPSTSGILAPTGSPRNGGKLIFVAARRRHAPNAEASRSGSSTAASARPFGATRMMSEILRPA